MKSNLTFLPKISAQGTFALSFLVLGLVTIFPAPSLGDSKQAAKGAPPNGLYEVNKISGSSYIHIGTLEIKGNTYRGLVAEGSFQPFTLNGAKEMVFSKGLVGMPDGWKLKPAKYVGNDESGHPWIQVYYDSARGAAEVADAIKEK
ncbi:hypothetical protein KA183_11915 [bacterium]|nr:hypothetical protein [bacterium]QQR57080.1 MAG: hypothetical protein IPG59_19145 [Candidatus Melainabacteria bacterium]